ncbi:RNA chaperone Hfq [Metabacillus iocasae]|uniref:RNA chaperone Hfq n=1 Tax=Priestia iocasae TaxID=2291674 RepID=A0ABS2QUW9_9BACI|nr:RNA chaperone Hfq [Metabacillus iocasae]MBM7703073.1 RNA chaperone Hfq [Metabacillus iocasae]
MSNGQRKFDIQNRTLQSVINKQVTAFTVNGVRLTGILKHFDQYNLYLEVNGVTQMLLKSNVSTIDLGNQKK